MKKKIRVALVSMVLSLVVLSSVVCALAETIIVPARFQSGWVNGWENWVAFPSGVNINNQCVSVPKTGHVEYKTAWGWKVYETTEDPWTIGQHEGDHRYGIQKRFILSQSPYMLLWEWRYVWER